MQEFWLKCAIRECCDIEVSHKKDEGCYCSDDKRAFLLELSEKDLIRCEQVKHNWIRIVGFGKAGRKVYLDENGHVIRDYHLPN